MLGDEAHEPVLWIACCSAQRSWGKMLFSSACPNSCEVCGVLLTDDTSAVVQGRQVRHNSVRSWERYKWQNQICMSRQESPPASLLRSPPIAGSLSRAEKLSSMALKQITFPRVCLGK